jgi:transcriptional regulator with XRE-family HTH domain
MPYSALEKHSFMTRFNEAMVARGKRQIDLARAMNCSSAYIHNMQKGRLMPSHKRLLAVALVLDVDSGWLLGRKDEGGIQVTYKAVMPVKGPPSNKASVRAVVEMPHVPLEEKTGLEIGAQAIAATPHWQQKALHYVRPIEASMADKLALATRIQVRCRDLGCTPNIRRELEHATGIAYNTINSVLKGTNWPSTRTFILLAIALKLEPEELATMSVAWERYNIKNPADMPVVTQPNVPAKSHFGYDDARLHPEALVYGHGTEPYKAWAESMAERYGGDVRTLLDDPNIYTHFMVPGGQPNLMEEASFKAFYRVTRARKGLEDQRSAEDWIRFLEDAWQKRLQWIKDNPIEG